jgi:very-short-patch-repair endonuclease
LEFAENGRMSSDLADNNNVDAESPFEEEVEAALRQTGFTVKRQIGCSGYRIDLALVDPERPGQYVLGIECDGASYHRSATARDRDRLRQDILEGLGWTIHRVWSTDWVHSPERQMDKIKQAFRLAKEKIASDEARLSTETPLHEKEEPRDIPRSNHQTTQQHAFNSIDDVDDHTIRATMVSMITVHRSMEKNDLLRSTSQKLGFQRLGPKIKAKLMQQLEACIADRQIVVGAENRLTLQKH